MHYNTKGEKIYYASSLSFYNDILNLTLVGETMPDPKFEALHRAGINPRRDMYVFEFITQGRLIITDGDRQYTAREGDLMILNSNASHYYYSDPNAPVGKLFIACNGTYVDNMLKTFGISDTTVIRHANLLTAFSNLISVAQRESKRLMTATAELILQILYTLNPLLNESAQDSGSVTYPLHQRVASYIDSHIQEPLRLEDIAAHFSTTPITLNRTFKEHYHTTPKQYILNVKISVAKQLLASTKLPINRISVFLSFSNQNHFSTTFLKLTGCSPSQYRRQNPYVVQTLEDIAPVQP